MAKATCKVATAIKRMLAREVAILKSIQSIAIDGHTCIEKKCESWFYRADEGGYLVCSANAVYEKGRTQSSVYIRSWQAISKKIHFQWWSAN